MSLQMENGQETLMITANEKSLATPFCDISVRRDCWLFRVISSWMSKPYLGVPPCQTDTIKGFQKAGPTHSIK